MRRRRRSQDSLELFLDAICNMFGGFVFLMLFVVISTRATSEQAIEKSIEESEVSAAQFESMTLELEDLQTKWSAVSKMIEESRDYVESLTSPEILSVRRETLQTLDELQIAARENADKLARAARIEGKSSELDAALKLAERELAAAERARESAGEDAARRRAASARTAAPPQMRFSLWRKTEVGVILKYGRLYFWHKNVDTTRTFNSEDFYVVDESYSEVQTEPRIDRGVDLIAPGVVARLDKAFAPYSATSHTIAIVVSSDSYAEFGLLRDYLKERLFEIRPLIGEKGHKVYDRGGSDGRTQ